MKLRNIICLISAAALIAAVYLIIPEKDEPQPVYPESPAVSTVSDRISYFASHGWEVEELAGRNIVIPSDLSGEYEEYVRMQDKQGLPLRKFAGRDAVLYLYDVKNYSPESRKMLAELIVCEDTAVASMVYSEDGGSIRLSVD